MFILRHQAQANASRGIGLCGVRQAGVDQPCGCRRGLAMVVHGDKVTVASRNGTLAVLDTTTGADVWRMTLGEGLSAGAGSDGHLAAVITERNELVAVVAGQTVWRQRLPFASFTAPLVAGQRCLCWGPTGLSRL